MEHGVPSIVYANFMSDLAVDLRAHEVLRQWSSQAPRKLWLTRPGDVLVTPVPLSPAFRQYAAELLDVPADSVTVLTVPWTQGVPMAEALRRAGLFERLRTLAAERVGARLVPTALDRSTAGLAAALGVPVDPYGPGGPSAAALDVASRLNTKTGFRTVAERLGMRLPAGRSCPRSRLPETVACLLGRYDRVVVKPDRSAGGHGLRFLSRSEEIPDAGMTGELERAGGVPVDACGDGEWVVERCLDVARSVSIQMEARPEGPVVRFTGEMRTQGGCFTGYASPLTGLPQDAARELEEWGTTLGRHLTRHGYAGPYGVDAIVTPEGRLYATEANVRRTATTTPQTMVRRLAGAAGLEDPAWLLGKGVGPLPLGFADALERTRKAGLGWDPARREGVVLYADASEDGTAWRYAVIAGDAARASEIETGLAAAMDFRPAGT